VSVVDQADRNLVVVSAERIAPLVEEFHVPCPVEGEVASARVPDPDQLPAGQHLVRGPRQPDARMPVGHHDQARAVEARPGAAVDVGMTCLARPPARLPRSPRATYLSQASVRIHNRPYIGRTEVVRTVNAEMPILGAVKPIGADWKNS